MKKIYQIFYLFFFVSLSFFISCKNEVSINPTGTTTTSSNVVLSATCSPSSSLVTSSTSRSTIQVSSNSSNKLVVDGTITLKDSNQNLLVGVKPKFSIGVPSGEVSSANCTTSDGSGISTCEFNAPAGSYYVIMTSPEVLVGPCATFSTSGASTALSIPNLVSWLKPESLTGGNGTNISTWSDSSVNGHDFTQATVADQPVVAAAAVNGLNAAYFTGSDYLNFTPENKLEGGLTFFIVFHRTVASNTSLFLSYVWPEGLSATFDGTNLYIDGRPTVGSYDWAYSSAAVPDTISWYYATISYDPILTKLYLRLDGADVATVTYTDGTAGILFLPNHFKIGVTGDIEIAEVILYGRYLTSTEVTTVENYLKSKFNL